MNEETTKFLSFIKNKRSLFTIKGLKNHFAYKRFIKKIKRSSPDFDTLWSIGNFIKELEYCYMYKNEVEATVYSSNKYKANENGFKINSSNCIIVCKLIANGSSTTTKIEVTRKINTKNDSRSTVLEFIDSNWANEEDNDTYNNIFLDSVVSIIWFNIIDLMDRYYRAIDKFGSFDPSKIL